MLEAAVQRSWICRQLEILPKNEERGSRLSAKVGGGGERRVYRSGGREGEIGNHWGEGILRLLRVRSRKKKEKKELLEDATEVV